METEDESDEDQGTFIATRSRVNPEAAEFRNTRNLPEALPATDNASSVNTPLDERELEQEAEPPSPETPQVNSLQL